MPRGVAAARNEIIFSATLTSSASRRKITRIVTPVTSGDTACSSAFAAASTYWANRLLHFTPILGGERALRKALWDHVPPDYKTKFPDRDRAQFLRQADRPSMGFTVLRGLSQVIKEKKRGLLPGCGSAAQ